MVSSIKIKMYPAKNGDAFLISSNMENDRNINILVDAGYSSTFKEHIAPDLQTIHGHGGKLDLVVATHIDADHICGLIELFKQNGNADNPKIIHVSNIYHNTIRSINSLISNTDSVDDLELLSEIKTLGYPEPNDSDDQEEISARQGSSLAALLFKGGYHWNGGDGTKSIDCLNHPSLAINQAVKLDFIAPTPNRLEQLKEWWIRELGRFGYSGNIGKADIFDDAFEFYCAKNHNQLKDNTTVSKISVSKDNLPSKVHTPDPSITNSSSIAFIANINKCRLLFLGDAWSEDIEVAIKNHNEEAFPQFFDVIKVSHHGSLNNTNASLLELIDSPIYLIPANGKHDHPALEVLKEIVDRPSKFKRHLYFSYSTPASEELKNYISIAGAEFSVYENANDWIVINSEVL